jgi:hypothetical protein
MVWPVSGEQRRYPCWSRFRKKRILTLIIL